MATFDLGGLASSSLPTIGGGSGGDSIGNRSYYYTPSTSANPTWHRSLHDLKVAGAATATGPTTSATTGNSMSTTAAQEASGRTLLARNSGIDLTKISQMSRSLLEKSNQQQQQQQDARTTTSTAAKNNLNLSVDENINIHQKTIFEELIKKERIITKERSNHLIKEKMQKDWNRLASAYVKTSLVGNRTIGAQEKQDSGTGSQPPPQSLLANSTSSAPTAAYTGAKTPYAAKRAQSIVDQIGGAVQQTQQPVSLTTSLAPDEIQSIQTHVGIVAEINQKRQQKSNTFSSDVFDKFQHLSSTSSSTTATSAYNTAWKLLKHMTSNVSKASTNSDAIAMASACGALSHLCHQFQNHISTRVRNATASKQDISTPFTHGFVSTIASYVKLEFGTSNLTPWTIVYHALRCGDAISAMEVIENSSSFNNSTPIADVKVIRPVLAQYVALQKQQHKSCMFDNMFTPPIAITEKDRQPLIDLYQRYKGQHEKQQQGLDVTVDPFMISVLALLGLTESINNATSSTGAGSNVTVVTTIEDYLFGALWDAIHPKSSTNRNPIIELTEVGELIKGWGPDYFCSSPTGTNYDVNDCWSYALPLLATQQYQTALSYIADYGGFIGLLQSTHIALVLGTTVGMEITDLSANSIVPADRNNTRVNVVCGNKKNDLETELLIAYSKKLQYDDPLAALEYLIQIRTDRTKRKELSRLIVDTQKYCTVEQQQSLVNSGSGSGSLYIHFESNVVSKLLVDAADEATRRNESRIAAELLLSSKHYGKLIELLNRQLALQIQKVSSDPERAFWYQAAQNFNSSYLTIGRTDVAEALEKERSTGLVDTFHLLTNLFVFVDYINVQNYEHAWNIIDKMNLLPHYEKDMSAKVQQYHALDSVVKDAFPSVVLMNCMESLSNQCDKLKSSMMTSAHVPMDPNVTTTHQRLQEIRNRARLLVTFTGLILPAQDRFGGSGGDINSRMARMEARMM